MEIPDIEPIGLLRAAVGESIVWDQRDATLLWVDIRGKAVMRTDQVGASTQVMPTAEMVGAVVPLANGDALTAQETGLFELDFRSGRCSLLSAPLGLRPDQRFNEVAVDPVGRLMIGTMRTRREELAPDGALYRYQGGRWETLLEGFWTINGLAFSPDGRTLYLSDSYHEVQTIWACDYDPASGLMSSPRVFATMHALDGRPDGAAVDATGCYWSAAVGGGCLYRFTPEGVVDRRIALPVENPTKPAFGGENLDRLFVTSMSVNLTLPEKAGMAGRLIALDVGVTGLALPACGG